MNQLLNIPKHINCNNCGECCGVIPATPDEIKAIQQYLSKHEDAYRLAVLQSGRPMDCPFRDIEHRCCIIYPVRPVICRLMGVTVGMDCKNGNTNEIDGRPFLAGHDLKSIQILNTLNWEVIG